jgi:signal transduction histidine kinase
VQDNGVGMRPESGASGVGLQLIRAFAAQLRGTLAFAEAIDAQGTAVTLTFPRGGKH